MDPVFVVGAGIAGVACARVIADAGLPVIVLDRGRRVGGRMASPMVNGRPVDTGASYFTVSDPVFTAVVEGWQARGLAGAWTDTFTVLGDGPAHAKSGPMRWGAAGGLRSLVEDLAEGLLVEHDHTVQAVTSRPAPTVDGRPASAVALAMPDPQARRLLSEASATRTVVGRAYEPTLALVTQWSERGWPADFDGAFVQGEQRIAWIADDGRRRGDGAPVLVAHSTPDFARQHLQRPDEATGPMVAAVRDLLDLGGAPTTASVHRWTFAHPGEPRQHDHHLGEELIGLCGDGWCPKPRVEGAYLSGRSLGEAFLARLS
jgi:predicted NAD/FAD-dependent oxidoreductase